MRRKNVMLSPRFFHGDVVILHAVHRALKVGQLVIMRCEQRFASEARLRVGDVLGHSARDAHAVERGRAAPDLVQHHKAFGRGAAQDLGHLRHFHHEGGLAGRQVVRSAHAGEDGVHNARLAALCGHERADLRHQDDQRRLAHERRFARHIRPGDQAQRFSPQSSSASFGTNGAPLSICSITGWRPSSITTRSEASTVGRT